MFEGYSRALTVAAAVGSGLVAGVYFAFSAFVMQALRELPDAPGLAAMQAINRAAPSPLFMIAFLGSAIVCAVLAVSALTRLDEPATRWQLAGSALYLAGFLVTIVYHVPRNDALAGVNPASPGAVDAWRSYLGGWIAWNHVRTLACLAAAVTLVLGLRAGAPA